MFVFFLHVHHDYVCTLSQIYIIAFLTICYNTLSMLSLVHVCARGSMIYRVAVNVRGRKVSRRSKHWNFREKQFIQHVHARDRELPSLAQKKLECIIIAIIYGFTLQIWIPCSYQVIHDVAEALLGRRGGMHFAAQRQQVGL